MSYAVGGLGRENIMATQQLTDKEQDESRRGIYEKYLEDLGRIGGRHETVRAFYLTLLTAVWAFVALSGKDGIFVNVKGDVLTLAGLVGIATCAAWLGHMRSYSAIFSAKKATLCILEGDLLLKPFTEEETILRGKWYYMHGSTIDSIMAVVFAALFVGVLVFRAAQG